MVRDNDTVDLEFWRTDSDPPGFGCQLRLSPAQARELLKREARTGFGAIYSLFGSREKFVEKLSEKLGERDTPLPAQPQVRMKFEAMDENGEWQPVQTSDLTADQATELAIANMLHGAGTLADAIHDQETRAQILRWCRDSDGGT
jgi:hypothetical protein